MSDQTYRLIYAGLGLTLVAVIALAFGFSPSGEETPLPDPVERVFPLPNDSVIRQAALEIDMEVGYEIAIFVDGVEVPSIEYTVQTGTNLYTWQPRPGRSMARWTPGLHEVRIEWDRPAGIPDPGSYAWTFRVQ